ncbi:MAG: 50S ribosomal protein L6 [Alphaproteobacteria bacterium MarineAlpha2_Bin1]|nr:MAG: 50S ribosomal protein L6 [Alphaproteobacteria bacterium MarineAlpha2_Bin1]|tara:strand:+ start:81 stop:614 length:534 start_codon:yes stop_codon:yes gene_type:complete
MSRIGKIPIDIPSGVDVKIEHGEISVKGPKGSLNMALVEGVEVKHDESKLSFLPIKEVKNSKALWGLQRTLVNNLIIGVTNGFSKQLEINGVGYRAQLKGSDLVLNLGFSHDVNYKIPEGISITAEDQNHITVSGTDKQKVGQVAAEIRSYRPPEPYKGKGVKYKDEFIVRKEGKKK